ncbi:hypothetical protein JIG36_41750 [Actinoplanes sp. LDG1-06]|uniref:Uncharacterized protein n=1 Tax=Paractinoplanes ovalisporus TaxID=2810368 RepID=A0ABS2AQA8_9ACTN|nr:hypothetical protein [Actinoplanes ovalisporus]MBM2622048.1 hypothetical protein [Actinoplanes ovalisporus]
MNMPVFYDRPAASGSGLTVAPALASWDKAESAGQIRFATFLGDVSSVVATQARTTADPLALRLDVALKDYVHLLALNDLDNYLFPLVPQLTNHIGRPFTTVWATKRHGATSSVAVDEAHAVDDPGGTHSFDVRTTASSETVGYKQQIRDQIPAGAPLPEGGITLQLAFVVGPNRNWANLWKPTIDSLGSLLGHDPGAHEWNPRDGRITTLGLHRTIDPAVGNDVVIAVRARP